jgi:heme/copper-type cytochrome/quinol oxidase subunit 2
MSKYIVVSITLVVIGLIIAYVVIKNNNKPVEKSIQDNYSLADVVHLIPTIGVLNATRG